MCISMHPAEFKGTTVYLGEGRHPQNGSLVHVLGYQNTAVNLNHGPNAMLIHIPAALPMSHHNFLDTTGNRRFLKDMVAALTPTRTYRSMGVRRGAIKGIVQIFDHDIYTVVLAENARDIPNALGRVPENRRPNLNLPLFNFYEQAYPGYHLALFCFNNRDARVAAPTLLWYTPMDTELFRLPALDCHSGDIPDVTGLVAVDHWVITSTLNMRFGSPTNYRDPVGNLAGFLPDRVMGYRFEGIMNNGDFGIRRDAVTYDHGNDFFRLSPPYQR